MVVLSSSTRLPFFCVRSFTWTLGFAESAVGGQPVRLPANGDPDGILYVAHLLKLPRFLAECALYKEKPALLRRIL